MMINQIIPSLTVIIIAFISAFSYNRTQVPIRKPGPSMPSFRYVYYYLQLSTIVFTFSSYWSDSSLLFLTHKSIMLRYIGIIICFIAIVLFHKSLKFLGEQYSPCYNSVQPSKIITIGIYHYIRHPLYASNLLLLLGAFISSGSLIILLNLIVLFFYYLRAINLEEKYLCKIFPNYKLYKKNTNKIFPWVY